MKTWFKQLSSPKVNGIFESSFGYDASQEKCQNLHL